MTSCGCGPVPRGCLFPPAALVLSPPNPHTKPLPPSREVSIDTEAEAGLGGGSSRLPVVEPVLHQLTHLPGVVVLDQGVQRHHAVDLQQHWRGAELLLAWAPAQVAGGWAAPLLLAVDLHAGDEVVVRKHLCGQQAREIGDEWHGFQFLLVPELGCFWFREREENK